MTNNVYPCIFVIIIKDFNNDIFLHIPIVNTC